MARHDTLAAVDLGSNSFHLQIGRVVDGQIYPLDSVREVVRLGGGLTAEKRIDRATQARRARGARQVRRAAARLPAPGGARGRHQRAARGEELAAVPARGARRARLPDRGDLRPRGSAPDLPRRGALAAGGGAVEGQRRLVVDVGGGSTEFIIGTGLEPQLTESLYMGCVSYSLKYFPDGRIDKPRMKAAELAARQELAGIVRSYRADGLGGGGRPPPAPRARSRTSCARTASPPKASRARAWRN